MSNEIENITVRAAELPKFKNAELNEAAKKISAIGADMAAKNIEIAKIFGEILQNKSYEDDGFKSVGEFAEKTFGIKKSLAYQLANVGKRFYLNPTETAKKAAALLPSSNLAEIVNMEDGELEKRIENGEIAAGTTQKQLRALKSNTVKPKVLPKYHFTGTFFRGFTGENFEYDEMDEADIEARFGFEDVDVKKVKAIFENTEFHVWINHDGDILRFRREKVDISKKVKAKTKRKSLNEYTLEELQEYIELMKGEKAGE